MKKNTILQLLTTLCVAAVVCFTSSSCRKQALEYTTTSDVNIVDYLRKYPDQFSEFVKILDRTNISPFLNAYGAYTCFAPTNDAIKIYLQEVGKISSDQIDTASLRSLCRFHLLEDTITTKSFTDGKMPTPTMYGQFLITGVNSNGATVINRQATLTQGNILTGNGIIHVINRVLQPATQTIAQMVESNPRFSIFTQALKATGLYDSLNIANNPDTTRRFLTFLAQSDSILRTVQINNYADLVRKYNNTGNPKNVNDSLYLYMAYHILPGAKYVADIVSAPSHMTLAPLSVITTSLDGQTVLLNEATFNGVFEAGVAINRPRSDNSAINGALHELDGDIFLKVRTPITVNWDLGDQPEIRKLTSIFRKPSRSISFAFGQLSEVTWQNQNLSAVTYFTEGPTTANHYYFDDGFGFNLRTPANTNNWIQFKTPLLVKGRYKVWLCYRRANMGAFTQVSFNGVALPKIVDFTQALPGGTEEVREAQGFKRYTITGPSNNAAQLAGIIDVPVTDRHTIRFTAIRDNGTGAGNSVTMDMIQFIPVDAPTQIRPWFGRDGSILP